MQSVITGEMLKGFEEKFEKDPVNRVAMNAAVKNGINASADNFRARRDTRHDFSVKVETGEITDQKSSGRCWMFAALNVMRLEVMKKLNLKTCELSQSYSLFWDKLEKTNYFLESIIETADEPLDGRLVHHLLTDPLCDGGQWDMFANIVEKYGVVPKDAMPESASSSATAEMNKYLTCKLREFACSLREAVKGGASEEGLASMKEEMLSTVYRMLCICLGTPPKKFTYETRDKDDKFVRVADITPQDFYKEYVGLDMDDYVSVINAPTADKPYERMYTVSYLGNIKGGRDVAYLNLPAEELKRMAIAQMKDGNAVWFGSDVGQSSSREGGLMDLDVHDVEDLFSTEFTMDKAQRLDYGESLMTHAMVLTGVNLDEEGKPNRWRVENSWGKDAGKDGYYVMTDRWFDEYTYQVVVNKKYLTDDQRKLLETEPIELKPWDPMGSLAR